MSDPLDEANAVANEAAALMKRVTLVMREVDPSWPKGRGARVLFARRPDGRLALLVSDREHEPGHGVTVAPGDVSYLLTPAGVDPHEADVLEQVDHVDGSRVRRVYVSGRGLVDEEITVETTFN